MLQLGRFRHESKRDKAGKTAGFILQLAKLAQVIDPLLNGLDVPKQHGASAATTHLVPDSMDFLPFFGGFFPAANLVTDNRIENLCAAAGERIETGVTQRLEGHLKRHLEDAVGQVANLDRGECLNMETGIERAKGSQKIQIPFARERGMETADHVDFGNSKFERVTRRLDDLRDGQFEGMRVALAGAEGAELARENADVRIVDVPIQDISGPIPVFPLPDNIGDRAPSALMSVER